VVNSINGVAVVVVDDDDNTNNNNNKIMFDRTRRLPNMLIDTDIDQ